MRHEALVRELVDVLDIHKDLLRRSRRMLELFDMDSPFDEARASEEEAAARQENLHFEQHETSSLDRRSRRFIEQMVEIGVIAEFPPSDVWAPPTETAELDGPRFLKTYPGLLSKSLVYLAQFQTELAIVASKSEKAESAGAVYHHTIIGSAGIVATSGGTIGDIVNQGNIGSTVNATDSGELAKELSALWSALRKDARADDISADIDIGRVAEAAKAASEGDGQRAQSALGEVSKWVLDTAQKIGVPLAVAAITAAFGLK